MPDWVWVTASVVGYLWFAVCTLAVLRWMDPPFGSDDRFADMALLVFLALFWPVVWVFALGIGFFDGMWTAAGWLKDRFLDA